MRRLALMLVLGACGARAPRGEPVARRALGMNDVSILLPLPTAMGAPVVATIEGERGVALVGRGAYEHLVTATGDLGPKQGELAAYRDVHLVAVRFDLCDRQALGPCPAGAPGRLRLVLQPCEVVAGELRTQDVAIHAFYPIAAAELPGVIDELRAMAGIAPVAGDAPLQVSPAARSPAYVARLKALVLRYARADRLARATVIGQLAGSAAFAWAFRGVDRVADARGERFVAMAIPGLAQDDRGMFEDEERGTAASEPGHAGATQQRALLAGGDTVFDARPVADAPAGFAIAINGAKFAAAGDGERRAALGALVEIQDPTRHDTNDTQCLACHVATYLTLRRAAALHVEPGRFASRYDTRVASVADRDARVMRAFGWAGSAPAISQRVANETAQVLAEVEARYPR